MMRRFLCILLAALMLIPATCTAQSADELLMLQSVYRATASSPVRTWRFPYSDAWFQAPASTYQHELAQSSLGMALAAFHNAESDEHDANIRDYLTKAGFGELQSEQYDITPTIDTIATMIGQKRIGDKTLIAVAVRGGGYKNEWLSNFTVGNEERHVGFNAASQKVQSRIREYLRAHGITGGAKLWISGYSRAAAVSNITAADMMDSGLFEDVYAYTFATPRTTKKPGAYTGIFNIMGKFDPVPCIPFAEWGYERFGTDLYTPAQETDSDYFKLAPVASFVSKQLTGQYFWNNTEINRQLRTVMDYLLGVLPTSAVYEQHMQDILIKVWQDKSIPNLSAAVIDLMQDAELITEDQRFEMEQLLDYLSMATYITVADSLTGSQRSQWNPSAGMATNIALEHVPDVYIAWMFAAESGDALFTANDAYLRFVCPGDMTLWLLNDEGQFLCRVDEQGNVSDEPNDSDMDASLPADERPRFSVMRKGTQTIITLPKDSDYFIIFQASKTETLMYFGTEYSIHKIRGSTENLYYIDAEKDQYYYVYSSTQPDGDTKERLKGSSDYSIQLFGSDVPYSASIIAMLENMNAYHLTFEQIITITVVALALLIALIVLVIVVVIRRRRRKKRLALQTENMAAGAADEICKGE